MVYNIMLILIGIIILGGLVYGLGILIFSKNEYENTSSTKTRASSGKAGSHKK